jgi:hypothetical protein
MSTYIVSPLLYKPEMEHDTLHELSVAMLRASPVDVSAYEQRSYEVFRALAASLGWPPEGLVDHLKHIPRELVGIATDDPKALDSFENFLVALRGPP